MSDIVGIHHIGFTVADVERSARWYVDVLGYTRGLTPLRNSERADLIRNHWTIVAQPQGPIPAQCIGAVLTSTSRAPESALTVRTGAECNTPEGSG